MGELCMLVNWSTIEEICHQVVGPGFNKYTEHVSGNGLCLQDVDSVILAWKPNREKDINSLKERFPNC